MLHKHTHHPQNRFRTKDTPHVGSVRLVSCVADNKGIVSCVASMACRMSILRLWRAAGSNLRIACVAVSNLDIWGPTLLVRGISRVGAH